MIKNKKRKFFIFLTCLLFTLCNNPSNYEERLNIIILGQNETFVRDTLVLELKIERGFYEREMLFCWQEENDNKTDTLSTPYYHRAWDFPDTGEKKD